MSQKMNSSEQGQFAKFYVKKLYCPQHGNKYIFKCNYKYCANPFLCSQSSCLQGHFHHQNEGKLVITKFDSTKFTKNFGELERVLTKEDFAVEAKQLKSFIDELKLSMVAIYKDYRELHTKKESFSADFSKPFQIQMMEKVEETINIGHNLRRAIDTLKSKVNIPCLSTNGAHIHPDQSPSKLIIGSQSPLNSRSQASQKKALIETTPNTDNQKDTNKQYEQGQVIFQNSPKQINCQAPIQLQLPNESVNKTPNIYKNKNQLPAFRPELGKDNFQQLFQNGITRNKLNKTIDNLDADKSPVESSSDKLNNQNSASNSNSIPNANGVNSCNSLSKPMNLSAPESPSAQVHQQQTMAKRTSLPQQNLKIYQRDFFLKKDLTIFLQQRLKDFSWGLCQDIYSSNMPLKSIDKFHQMLQGKKNLLFVFIGQSSLLGSYYPLRYPRLKQKLRNDPKSFLFISNNELNKILEYRAVPCEFHLSVSERLYMCHGNTPSYADGIRTFQKNLQSLNYCLPSVSYKYHSGESLDKKPSDPNENATFNGILKVKQFFILQFIQNNEFNGNFAQY